MEVSGWLLVEQMGKGGNGHVWNATKGERQAAVKFLRSSNLSDDKRLLRFRDEVCAMYACPDVDGVITMIDLKGVKGAAQHFCACANCGGLSVPQPASL